MPNTRISDLTAAVSVSGTDVYPSVQTAGIGPVKTSLDQIKVYVTGLTAGYIPFGAGTSSAFSSSINLFWDSSNSRLGVGTNSPLATFHAKSGSGATLAQIVVGFSGSYNYYDANAQIFRTAAANETMRIDTLGNVAIGTSGSSFAKLTVSAGADQLEVLPSVTTNTTRLLFYNRASSAYANGNYDGASHRFLVNNTEYLRVDATGKVLIGTTTAGASKLTVNDDSVQINTAKTPASATATGTTGQVCWDSNYIYVCTATNTWKRAAIATW